MPVKLRILTPFQNGSARHFGSITIQTRTISILNDNSETIVLGLPRRVMILRSSHAIRYPDRDVSAIIINDGKTRKRRPSVNASETMSAMRHWFKQRSE